MPTETLHILKVDSELFDDIVSGRKPWEFRRNDRGFQQGDVLLLCECPGEREILVRVTYIVAGPRYGIPEGFCVMTIERVRARG